MLAGSGVLHRVWWLDNRTQEWLFYDPDPRFVALNTLTTVDLAANPPVVVFSVSCRQEFRGRTSYRGWNYVGMRRATAPGTAPRRETRRRQLLGEAGWFGADEALVRVQLVVQHL